MKRVLLAGLFLFLFIAGCTANTSQKISETTTQVFENECYDCRIKCPAATRTSCVNDKCECYYGDTNQANNNLDSNNQQNNNGNSINNSTNFIETLPSCGEKNDYLTVSPLKSGDFQSITPLGNLNPSGHTFPTDHIYLAVKRAYENGKDVGTANVPLYMPGDAWITEINVSEHLSEDPPYQDYDLVFFSCKELSFRFGHITTLSDELASKMNVEKKCDAEYETGGKRFRRCLTNNLFIPVSSGQEIGTAGGNPNQNALDIWTTDTRIDELVFANPERWNDYSMLKYTACPLDYFTSPEKEKLYSLVGGFDGSKRTIEPICGTIEQDILGSAQGVWFVAGTTNAHPEDPHLALVLDNVNPLINVFSVGNSITGLASGQYSFTPQATGKINRAFADVKPGSIYCFEPDGENFAILVELTSETTLKIEKQNTSSCDGTYSFSAEKIFER